MKTFKPYLLSLLTLISAVPMGAMQSAPQPAHQANVSISDAQKLLNDLRKAWNAEIEKLQNNTEQSKKMLNLAIDFKPFVARLGVGFENLLDSLNTYIEFATFFNKANDAQLASFEQNSNGVRAMTLVYRGLRNLIEAIIISEEELASGFEFTVNAAQMQPEIKSALVHDGAQRKQKRTVQFNDKVQIKEFVKEKPMPEEERQVIEQIRELPVRIERPRTFWGKVQQAFPITPEEKKHIQTGGSMLIAPAVGAGLTAAYNAVAPVVSNNLGGQLVAVRDMIGSNLGRLGIMPTLNFALPAQVALWTSLGGLAGLGGAYYYFTRPNQARAMQPMAQGNARRSSVVIEELDNNGNVIASSNDAAVQSQPKKESKKNSGIITKRRVIAASKIAGYAAMFGGLGYLAYNYLMPQAASQVTPAVAVPVAPTVAPIMQASMMPTAPITAAVSSLAPAMTAPAGSSIMGQNPYQWVTGSSINPWM